VDGGFEGAGSFDALKKQLATLERRMADAVKLPPKPKGGKGKAASDAPTAAATATATAATATLSRKSSFGWQVRSYGCGSPARLCMSQEAYAKYALVGWETNNGFFRC